MTDVETTTNTEVESAADRMARFNALFDDDADELTAEQVQMQIAAQIVAADTVEAIFATRDTIGSKDYVDQPFTLLGVDVRDSTIGGDGPPKYMVLRCANGDGEPFVLTSGSVNIMAAAWNAADRGFLPVRVVIRRAKNPSAAGYYALWLELVHD